MSAPHNFTVVQAGSSPSDEMPREERLITGPIFSGINLSMDAHVLLRIQNVVIKNCKGITEEEREELHQAVRDRFGALNLAATHNFKPRTHS